MRKRLSRLRSPIFIVEAMESRRLLSFSNADFSGLWNLGTMESAGTVQFDGAGHIDGGSVTDDSGSNQSPSGTYSISSSGTVAVQVGNHPQAGALNTSKNLAAVTRTDDHNHLAVVINSAGATYSVSDLTGTWNFFGNGEKPATSQSSSDSSNHGTLTFDGAGNFTGTIISDNSGNTDNVSGTYTVSPSGDITVNAGPMTFHGAMSNTKDIVVLSPTDLVAAATNNDTKLIMLVKTGASNSNAAVKGTWTIVGDGFKGSLKLDGAGHASGSTTESSGTQSFSGTYAVAADGTVSVHIVTGGNTNNLAGAISASGDVITLDQPGGGPDNGVDDMTVIIRSSDAAPVDQPPAITSVDASTTVFNRGDKVTFSSAGVSSKSRVRYFLDLNNNGIIDAGDKKIGENANAKSNFAVKVPTIKAPAGVVTILAQSINKLGTSSTVSTQVTINNLPPVIKKLGAPKTVKSGKTIKLSALGVTDKDGKVVQVQFALLLGDVASPIATVSKAPWSTTFDPTAVSLQPGTYTFLAHATDNDGSVSPDVSTTVTIT